MNLKDTLNQEGHSGIIEGNCRINYEGDYTSAKHFFKNQSSDTGVNVIFSQGIHPLGEYAFKKIAFDTENNIAIGRLIVLDDEVMVNIDVDIDEMPHLCRFRAILKK